VSTSASVERERKFLPDPTSPELREAIATCTPKRRITIRQGYVLRAGDEGELRLRETISDGTERRVMTVKRGTMPERLETEIELTPAQWDQLRPLVIGTEIRKKRFLVEVGAPHALIAEIDRFEAPNPGLVLIEVEFPSPEACVAFVPPQWFGRDVTGDPRYRNQNLARSVPHN
jgi:adenylate cyclase